MIGCRLRPITSSMFVLIFSTLRQVSVKVFRIPPSGPTLRAGAGSAAEIVVIVCCPPVRGWRFLVVLTAGAAALVVLTAGAAAGQGEENLVHAGLAEGELRELDA